MSGNNKNIRKECVAFGTSKAVCREARKTIFGGERADGRVKKHDLTGAYVVENIKKRKKAVFSIDKMGSNLVNLKNKRMGREDLSGRKPKNAAQSHNNYEVYKSFRLRFACLRAAACRRLL